MYITSWVKTAHVTQCMAIFLSAVSVTFMYHTISNKLQGFKGGCFKLQKFKEALDNRKIISTFGAITPQTLTPLNALVCIMIECSRVQTGLARSIVCMSIQEYQGSEHVGEVSSGSLVTIHPSQLGAPTCQRLLLLLPTISD